MIVFGKQVFFYILKQHKELIRELYLAKELDKKTFGEVARAGLKINKLDFKTAQSLARGGNHQGFLMDIAEPEFSTLDELKKGEFVAMLVGISDVGNIGAIVRSAYGLGASGVIFVGNSLAMSGVVRSSSGAALDMKIAITNEPMGVLNEFKQSGFELLAADGSGVNVREFRPKGTKNLLVLGSEGFGLPSKILKKCDTTLGIKMAHNFDSLNVSVAFAILCDRIINA